MIRKETKVINVYPTSYGFAVVEEVTRWKLFGICFFHHQFIVLEHV